MGEASPVVWITGGGSGIGRAISEAYARRGARVAVSGRREHKLQEAVAAIDAAGGEGLAVVCDVTDPEACAAAVRSVVDHWGRLDVAVANAGMGVTGRIWQLEPAVWKRQFDLNVLGVAHTIHAAMPALEESGGRMALLGSVASFLAAPKTGAYSASKAAVHVMGTTMSVELAKKGSSVTCTTIHPGFIESDIARVDNDGVFDPDRVDKRPAWLMWKTDDAAEAIVRAITRRRTEFVLTGHGKLAVFLGRHLPGLVRAVLSR